MRNGILIGIICLCCVISQATEGTQDAFDVRHETTLSILKEAFENRFDAPAEYIPIVRSRIGLESSLDSPTTIPKLHNVLGLLYRNIGLVDSAAQSFLRAKDAYARLGEEQFNSGSYNLMNLYVTELGDPIHALIEGRELLASTAALTDQSRKVMLLDAMAQVYFMLDSTELSMGYLNQGLSLAREADLGRSEIGLLFSKLSHYSCYMPGMKDLSFAYLDSAENYVSEDCQEQAAFLSLKGEILEIHKRYDDALAAIQEAESLDTCFDSPSTLETIYYRGYYTSLVSKNESLALSYLTKYDSVRSIVLDRAKVTAINHFQTLYETEQKEAAILRLEQENHISDLQRNFFIVLTFLFLAMATAAVIIYSNKLRHNRMLSEERIAKLEQEREVMNLQSMLYAQEEERRRIARDLHDGIGALLSAAKLHITNIESEMKKLTELDVLKSTEEVIDRANVEVRRVAHNMMPGVLVKLGLLEGIEDFFDRMRDSTGIKISFTYDEFETRFDNKVEVMIYRIVQELVNNTIKHAHASEIKLMIKKTEEGMQIDYKDDGMGFDTALLDDQSKFGLSGIKSRINFLNGEMEVSSRKGHGVHFSIIVPIQNTELS